MEGYLLVDKPAGWTSFDVANKVKHIIANVTQQSIRRVKVGHTGTLDPFATGLLIILVGSKYTKKSQDLLKKNKTYSAVMQLGKFSSTGDPEGEIKDVSSTIKPNIADIKQVFDSFIGVSMQRPSIYSAIKINGERAYSLARRNIDVELPIREITITRLDLIDYSFPFISLETEVSSGTYIRVLVEDVAKKLNTKAYTTNLRRIKIDRYSINDAISINDINEQNIGKLLKQHIV